MNERVSFDGILQGNNRRATCTVHATKVTLPGGGFVAYAKYSIEETSEALPEGEYQLLANGEVTPVRLYKGHWLSA